MGLHLSQQPQADALLDRDPLALLIGMVLDQQIPLERAFAGPWELSRRLGRDLDAGDLATADPETLAALFAQRPALHRFPGSMAKRVQELCRALVEQHGGDAAAVWRDATDGEDLRRRIGDLPGFGDQKTRIFVALLGKQCGVTPLGWREAAGEYGQEGTTRSVADITDPTSLEAVRDFKQRAKQRP